MQEASGILVPLQQEKSHAQAQNSLPVSTACGSC